MDDRRFDALARALAAPTTRRGLLGTMAAVSAGLFGGRGADAQVTQAQCGNVVCAANPGVCRAGCVCCVYANGNSRCVPPGGCTGAVTPPATTTTTRAPTTTTTTTAAPATTTTPAPGTTTTTTAAPHVCAGALDGVRYCGEQVAGCDESCSCAATTAGEPVCATFPGFGGCGSRACAGDWECGPYEVCLDLTVCCNVPTTACGTWCP